MAKRDKLEQIIKGCQSGRPDSFEALIDLYAQRCYGYFYRLTGNREVSNDLLSELFVKLVEKINTFNGGCFESWLFKTASNLLHDYLREKQKQARTIEAEKARLQENTGSIKRNENETFDKLQIQLNRLDEDTRELIMLRFYSKLSFKELARLRSEPIGTTLAKLHRGLKKLRQLMSD